MKNSLMETVWKMLNKATPPQCATSPIKEVGENAGYPIAKAGEVFTMYCSKLLLRILVITWERIQLLLRGEALN